MRNIFLDGAENFEEKAQCFWDQKWRELCLRLSAANIPIADYFYNFPLQSNWNDMYQDSYFMDKKQGIILERVWYLDKNGREIKTRWNVEKNLGWKKQKREIYRCKWTFLPLAICPKRASILYRDMRYVYRMNVVVLPNQENRLMELTEYTAYIETDWTGLVSKKRILRGKEELPDLPKKISFPKQVIAKINKSLAENYLKQLWFGPAYPVWHITKEGIATYMGDTDTPANGPSISILERLLSTNQSAAVLIVYLCFAVLKPFFPAYHTLDKQSPYLEAKKYLPKQFAVNISGKEAESLVACCCGYFQDMKSDKTQIVDGVDIQKNRRELTRLSVNEFEAKVLQNASVLWVNRVPAQELLLGGQIIDLSASVIPDDILARTKGLSLGIVKVLAQTLEAYAVNSYKDFSLKNWEDAHPVLDSLPADIYGICNKYKCFLPTVDVEQDEVKKPSERFSSPEAYIKYIRQNIFYDIEELEYRDRGREIATDLKIEIQKLTSDRLRKIRRLCKENKRLTLSLDSKYQNRLKKLKDMGLPSLGDNAMEKIAYLSTSFRVLVQAIAEVSYPPLSNEDEETLKRLPEQVDNAIISAFDCQLRETQSNSILESYVLMQIKEKRCARIRGIDSDKSSIKIWYDPRQDILLLPSKSYFDDLKASFQITDMGKNDFELELVQAGILCSSLRKNQNRRTYEVRVGKGEGRISVLKIKMDHFSPQFSKESCGFLAKMKNERTPYRSC